MTTRVDKTKTFCVHSSPDEAAIREAAKRNELPIDEVTEVPFILDPILKSEP